MINEGLTMEMDSGWNPQTFFYGRIRLEHDEYLFNPRLPPEFSNAIFAVCNVERGQHGSIYIYMPPEYNDVLGEAREAFNAVIEAHIQKPRESADNSRS